MSDEKDAPDEQDDSDWLASQFGARDDPPVAPPTVAPSSGVPPLVPPLVSPPIAPPLTPYVDPVDRSSFAPPPAPGTPSNLLFPAGPPPTPTPAQGGGFSWGLKPSDPVQPQEKAPATDPEPIAPPPSELPPTEAMTRPMPPADPAPTEKMDEVDTQSTQAFVVPAWTPAESVPAESLDDEDDSAIDSLFGDTQFQNYEDVGVMQTLTTIPTAADSDAPSREPRAPLTRLQRTLLWVAIGLVAAIVLIALFFFGTRIGEQRAEAASSPSPRLTTSATPTPTPTAGPAAVGVQPWTALQGGECIQPFTDAWALNFTVVDCGAPHAAQMIYKGALPKGSNSLYPADTKFQTDITPLCTAATVLNYAAAGAFTDIQVSFSYPPDKTSWSKGDRTFYCFVSRTSSGPITGNLAVPQAASTPSPSS